MEALITTKPTRLYKDLSLDNNFLTEIPKIYGIITINLSSNTLAIESQNFMKKPNGTTFDGKSMATKSSTFALLVP